MSSLLLWVIFFLGGWCHKNHKLHNHKLPNEDLVDGTRLWWCQKNPGEDFFFSQTHIHTPPQLLPPPAAAVSPGYGSAAAAVALACVSREIDISRYTP